MIRFISKANRRKYIQKRIMDFAIGIPALILIIPISVITAIAIRLESPGPIIFKQKRVGLNGEIFLMYKFRSMYNNADESIHEKQIEAYAEGKLDPEQGYKIKYDPRITKVGRFIRKTSIDEFPQIINVFKGEMSLVGPRPVPIYEANRHNLWQTERVSVLPGITGYWQVYGRSNTSFEEQNRLDIHYIRNETLWLNLKILLLTIPAALSGRGAG
jgi:lipopolysaccharide/colanic/teichoic acid biosynthesis glycosyltransferase